MLDAAAKGLKRGLEFARTTSQREYLSGPRPKRLDVVTARLRNSIATDVQRSGKGVIGRIGSNVKYARFHEFGFTGTQQVRAHARHTEDKLAGGATRGLRFVRDRAGNVIGQKRESVKQAQGRGVEFIRQQVRAHSRAVNYAGRPFIQPALRKSENLIKQAIAQELAALNKTTN